MIDPEAHGHVCWWKAEVSFQCERLNKQIAARYLYKCIFLPSQAIRKAAFVGLQW